MISIFIIRPCGREFTVLSMSLCDYVFGDHQQTQAPSVWRSYGLNKLENSWIFLFKNFQNSDKKYIVDKASIAINGISLTIANVSTDSFSISVIPHTYENTNLKFINENDIVNIEFDYLARFTERLKN